MLVLSAKVLAVNLFEKRADFVVSFPDRQGDDYCITVRTFGQSNLDTVENLQADQSVLLIGELQDTPKNMTEFEFPTCKSSIFASTVIYTELPPGEVNEWNVIGTQVTDANPKYFESGSIVNKVRVAQNFYKAPSFVSVNIWGKAGEITTNHVQKGSGLNVTGSLVLGKYSKRDTAEVVYTVDCKANQMRFLPRPKGQGGDSASSPPPPSNTPPKPETPMTAAAPANGNTLDDIPF